MELAEEKIELRSSLYKKYKILYQWPGNTKEKDSIGMSHPPLDKLWSLGIKKFITSLFFILYYFFNDPSELHLFGIFMYLAFFKHSFVQIFKFQNVLLL